MRKFTEEEFYENPYLEYLIETTIFDDKAEILKMKNGKFMNIHDDRAYYGFLKKIVADDDYFSYALKCFKGEIDKVKCCYFENGDTNGQMDMSRSTIIKGLRYLINYQELDFSDQELERYHLLSSLISYDKLMEDIKGKTYHITIDGISYDINLENMFHIMNSNLNVINNLFLSDEITSIDGIKKEHYLYAIVRYFKENNLLNDYDLPIYLEKIYLEMAKNNILDVEAINTHLEVKDTIYKGIEVDPNLKEEIFKGMSDSFSPLEKAIYVYIKMCQILSYDDEYYAFSQKGEEVKKHRDPNYISRINLNNKKAVCFEFNIIYSKLLSELGINFSTNYKGLAEEEYGVGHSNLEFRYDKFLVEADSVTSIPYGDLVRVKLLQPLEGIECINQSEKTQREFEEIKKRIYSLVVNDESVKTNHQESLEELLRDYQKTTTNFLEVPIEEKLSILMDKINKAKVDGINALFYAIQLKKILFTNKEKESNFGLTLIKEKLNEEERKATTLGIIAINEFGYKIDPERTKYYLLLPDNSLKETTIDAIQTKFDSGDYGFIHDVSQGIFGLRNDEVKKL